MTFELSSEQEQLVDLVRDLVTRTARSRDSLDGGPALDAGLWKQLSEVGIVAMAVPEDSGGSGGTAMDEVLVAEQLGYGAAAVPVVGPSVAGLWLQGNHSPRATELLSALASGARTVVGGLSAQRGADLGVTARATDGGWRLTGAVDDLIDGACADVLLLVAETNGGQGLFAVENGPGRAVVVDQPSLDPAQRLGAIAFTDEPAELLRHVRAPGEATLPAMERAAVLLAAQAVGAAQRALDLTVEYSLQRTAFGQLIGRFQAIKHTAAEMLLRTENARSAVYNAAWALDANRLDRTLAVHMAKGVATENAVYVVHAAIQCHGGIGFTWEHDLHLCLRRAKSAELALGQPEEHFAAIGALLVADADPRASRSARLQAMSNTGRDRAYHEELRSWLDSHLPQGWGTPDFRLPRRGDERLRFLRDLQKKMAAGRWVGIHWPEEFGGRSATLAQQLIYNSELVARGVPQLPGHRGMTIVGPTIIKHGTDAQRERFLHRIREAEDLWAGGFSEPGAGSDLASLRTRAVIDGDVVRVNGQKIWTSSAQWCTWIYTLVRTDVDVAKHAGISVLAIPLDAPGVTVRPIRQMNGAADFNEVFFENVEVPVENIIGAVNAGWTVNRTTLSHEHFTLFIGSQSRFARSLDDIVDLARTTRTPGGEPRSAEPGLRERIARAWTVSQLILVNGMRNVAKVEAGGAPGPEGSIAKLFGQEEEKRLFELAIDIAGPRGLLDRGATGAAGHGKWQFGYLGARAATIGGGTSEIHKNKIAEAVLGLPRDPWVDAADAR